ncbi:MAG: PFL_4703 family integrating conjugative element protein [Candidatus Thiodiazotropha sp. 6PLUC2]
MKNGLFTFENPSDNQSSAIRMLGRALFLLLIINGGSIATTFYALETIEVSLPPDPSKGALLKRGQKDETAIYTFALWYFQDLQHWPEAGQTDYRKNIDNLIPLLTPEYKGYLDRDFNRRKTKGELANRIRHIEPFVGMHYDEKRVQSLGSGEWLVIADYVVKEWYLGQEIKTVPLRYYLSVSESSVIDDNRFGLRLNGFYKNPESIAVKEGQS